ncbi:MAG: right-handed parallel beta-helix repeat-containing protein [candidate division WOR-3 bacterium]
MSRVNIIILLFCLGFTTTYIADTPGEIQSYTNQLQAGDTLLIMPGTYDMNWNISDRYGAESDWIVIQPYSSGVVINGVNYDNVIDIYNCHYVELRGIEITNSYNGSGIDGIKFRTTSDHILMENLHIHNLTGVGISANPAGQSFTYLTIRRCHIHGITDVGEGLYIGNHDGLTPVHHCLVELNWIHDCHPHKGIQFKRGTYLNIIQDNVVYNCDEAGIVLYKTDQSSALDNNIVRRNAIWNTPEGIFAVGQTNIDNNVIFSCDYGINVRNYGGWGMNDLYIRNNTIYHCNITCLRLDDWNIATGEMVCINNACYQDTITASAIQAPDGIGPGYVAYNRHYGQSQVTGSTLGNHPSQEFINPVPTPGVINLYPKSSATLLNNGTQSYGAPDDDFNLLSRPYGSQWDVGAYEWRGLNNPGWQIQEGFKEILVGIAEDKDIDHPANFFIPTILANGSRYEDRVDGILTLYDPLGRKIGKRLKNLPGGIYFYKIETAKKGIKSGKFIVIY